jgi:hypothetical protein
MAGSDAYLSNCLIDAHDFKLKLIAVGSEWENRYSTCTPISDRRIKIPT